MGLRLSTTSCAIASTVFCVGIIIGVNAAELAGQMLRRGIGVQGQMEVVVTHVGLPDGGGRTAGGIVAGEINAGCC